MAIHSFPMPFRDPSERRLMGPVPPSFEAFYRAHLRFEVGGRLRSTTVASLYGSWALEVGAPHLSASAIKRAMMNIGHSHFRSNQMHFRDVRLAKEKPETLDDYPPGPPVPDSVVAACASIEVIYRELENLTKAIASVDA